ncbi:hypothetical protein [Kitasatospora purpeofusca]|uniref:hypothetical protein n=1 Tax=Kitasatospora purpeofusca TaxID=67352 RepID=UPI003667E961
MIEKPARQLWAGFSGLILGVLFGAMGVAYLTDDASSSPWIGALGALLLLAGVSIAVKYLRKLRRLARARNP